MRKAFAGLLLSAFLVSWVQAKDYTLTDGGDLEGTLATAKTEYDAMAEKEASVIKLNEGTYTITQEMYLNWPVQIVGQTGDPEDVVIEGTNNFRICTINHADAELKDLTIAKGRIWESTSQWVAAGVRICEPYSTDRSNGMWNYFKKGAGGKMTHCVIRDCTIDYGHLRGILYMNGPKDKTIVDRCVIRDNLRKGSSNWQKGTGDIVTVASGRFLNSIVRGNTSSIYDSGGTPPAYQGIVATIGNDAEIVGCTIAGNILATRGDKKGTIDYIAGVYAVKGQIVNTLIAGNTSAYTENPRHIAWEGDPNCFTNCVLDAADPVNDTCLATDDACYIDPSAGDYRIAENSPACDAGTMDEAWSPYGELDLAGLSRFRTSKGVTTVDVGAYQVQKGITAQVATCTVPIAEYDRMTIHYEAVVSGYGDDPVFYWDFDGDGTADFITHETSFDRTMGVGSYDVHLSISNVVEELGNTIAAENGVFSVIAHPVHYVNINGENPVSPYMTLETAATNVQDAIDVAGVDDEVRIMPGDYPISMRINVLTDGITVCGATGNPDDVVIRAVTSSNGCMVVNAGANTIVHSLTLADGRGATGGPVSQYRSSLLAAVLCMSDSMFNASTDEYSNGGKGGVVSNCVIRGGLVDPVGSRTGGIYMSGANYLLTHCIITNNASRGGGRDYRLCVTAAALELKGGARAEHCLIANNRSQYENEWRGYYQAAVLVGKNSILRYSTVVSNACSLVGGVNVQEGGRMEKCVVAGNVLNRADTSNPRHSVWGAFGTGSFLRTNNEQNLADEVALAAGETVYGIQTMNAVDCAGCGLGAGTVETTTGMLVKRVRGVYRLPSSSPAIDRVPRGTEIAMPMLDVYGNPRLLGAGYDLGACERFIQGLMLLVR